MVLGELLTPVSRVLDVGVRDPGVADALGEAGVDRYLGLVLARDKAFLEHLPDRLESRFHPLLSAEQIRHNNADLLILRAAVARTVWGIRELRHVRYVAVEHDSRSGRLETHGALAVSRVLGRVRHRGDVELGGARFAVFEAQPVRPLRPRHYLSEAVGVSGLLRRLGQEGLDYVVLRWFEDLPDLAAEEDLDVLVADRDLHRLHEILAEEPGTIPVDIYSETGLEGADFRGMAYYPPGLATQILDRAVTHPSGARVPSPEDHLHSLAYHAAYHKGADSGLRSRIVPPGAAPDHDYAEALAEAARSSGREFPTSLEEVDAALEQAGWRPPRDTLRRLAPANRWVQQAFFPDDDAASADLPEPSVFFVRERALETLGRERVLAIFDEFAFEVLLVRELSPEERVRAAEDVRGGNWGRGPFPESGGDPVLVVFAAHYGPRRPPPALHQRYPRLTNGDVLHVKVRMRELAEQTVGEEHSFNPVHSSDDEFEAWEYLEVSLPQEADRLRMEIARRRDDYRTDKDVLAVLSSGRRAKVEVVREGTERRVRKTFAPHARRFLERELSALRALAGIGPEIPAVLATGPNWFEMPHFDNVLDGRFEGGSEELVPLPVLRQMVDVLRRVHAAGLDLIDAKPANFLLDPVAGLKLVDLEFAHPYRGPAPAFQDIYPFAGLPADYDGDRPFGAVSYDILWRPYTGLPLPSLLDDPPWRQRLRRGTHRATASPVRAARLTARHGRSGLRAGRAGAGAAYRRWARERARVPM